MNRTRIKLLSIGHLPMDFSRAKIKSWQSSVFEVMGEIDSYALRCDSDSEDWVFSDDLVKTQIPVVPDVDFTIAIVSVPIQYNWYARRLGNNQIVFTFHQVKEILSYSNIPLENVIYRILYAYTLLYRRSGNCIPNYGEVPGYTHDETRGCLFDMNGIKTDLVASCDHPIICGECQEKLRQERVSDEVIEAVQKEIKAISLDTYYLLLNFVKKRPLLALFISSAFAVLLGVLASVIASFAYEAIK
ncbi:hypothetical protein [Rhodoferax sp. BAB1]|uniref:hypothetical protein n=1 Tax=Rhodoferax sp. BAB1 TaxID=2741720 RepID=UPI00157683B8|nr:hypothetical protein [Rhodoferax sp. BAB1]QKO22298.1 hypothetical protein HTY51_10560 [Rhodoferax sp. BAB1]